MKAPLLPLSNNKNAAARHQQMPTDRRKTLLLPNLSKFDRDKSLLQADRRRRRSSDTDHHITCVVLEWEADLQSSSNLKLQPQILKPTRWRGTTE
jgi:hypothetical protein